MSQNIVVVEFDSVRADHTPLGGYDRETTPYLSDRAELTLTDCHVPGVGTPVSVAGQFTGHHTSGSGEITRIDHWQAALHGHDTLADRLRDAGYYTVGIHQNGRLAAPYGWDRGFDAWYDHLEDPGTIDRIPGGAKAAQLLRGDPPEQWRGLWPTVRRVVDEAPEPWFLWILLVDTHQPYWADPTFHAWDQPGVRGTLVRNFVMRRWPGVVGERPGSVVNAYDNTIRSADTFVRRLDQFLQNEGHSDTPTIVTSDHGDCLGEHATFGHPPRPSWHRELTHVPLWTWNVGEAGVVESTQSLLSLGSTVLELAGVGDRLGDQPPLVGDDRRDDREVVCQNRLGDGRLRRSVVDGSVEQRDRPPTRDTADAVARRLGALGYGGDVE